MREVVLDTETTGLQAEAGHRIIEVGCVELLDAEPTGRTLQAYIDPGRDIDAGATDKHGLTRADVERLSGGLRFVDIAEPLVEFCRGALLVIHNAPFDLGFLDAELERCGPGWGDFADHCAGVVCTVELSRHRVPGIKHSLDSMCDHFGIDRSGRRVHGALVDAVLAAEVYRALMLEEKTKMYDVVTEVMKELERATAKFPTWPTDPLHALAVLGEEFGELNKEMLQLTYEPHKTGPERVRTEAIQTAAMALRLVMSLEEYEYKRSPQHVQGMELCLAKDAKRYRWLRERDLDTIDKGGVFAGQTPQHLVLNGDDLDAAVDAAMSE